MSERKNHNERSKETPSADGTGGEPRRPRIDWDDPSVPVGNAPPLPRWPLIATGLAWLVWIGLMVVLAVKIGAEAGTG